MREIFDPCVNRVLTLIDSQIEEVSSQAASVKVFIPCLLSARLAQCVKIECTVELNSHLVHTCRWRVWKVDVLIEENQRKVLQAKYRGHPS